MSDSYIIGGGTAGVARLSVLAQAMAEATNHFLDKAGPLDGARILDAGCGAGDSSRELARRAGPRGAVVGIDLDAVKIEAAQASSPSNASFVIADAGEAAALGPFDVVYARFLLSHLTNAPAVLAQFHAALAPGGRLLVEDVDFPSHFCWPPRAAFDRYVAWYQEAALARGADPAIGHKLPALVLAAGFSQVQARAEQPAALSGPIKAYAPLTLAAISEAVIGGGVEASEIAASLVDLEVARDDDTVFMSLPRVVQCWATRD